jgi:anti-anti-sigma factor
MNLNLSEQQIGRIWVVTARGRLDGVSNELFTQHINALITEPEPRLIVDFSDVDFVSSAGLRAVLTLIKKVKGLNGKLALCAVQAPVLEILEITGFSAMIDIHAARAAALGALS